MIRYCFRCMIPALLIVAGGVLTQSYAQNSYGGPFTKDSATVVLMHFDGNYNIESAGQVGEVEKHGNLDFRDTRLDDAFGQQLRLNNDAPEDSTYLSIPDTADLDLTSSWTIELWVYFFTMGNASSDWRFNPQLVGKNTGSNSFNYQVKAFHGSDELNTAYTTVNENQVNLQASWSPSIGNWNHVVFVRDAARNQVVQLINGKVNGRMYDQAVDQTPKTSDQPVRIGGSMLSNRYLDGFIDELRISDVARPRYIPPQVPTATQLSDQYETGDYTVRTKANAVGSGIDLSTIQVIYRVDDESWQSKSLVGRGGGEYKGSIPEQENGAHINYYIQVTDSKGLTSTYPKKAVANSNYLSFYVFKSVEVQNLSIVREDRTAVIDHNPRFTFELKDGMADTLQSYHIQVSTDSTFSTVDMWDSGKVETDTNRAAYEGAYLEDGATYFMRIKLYGDTVETRWEHMSFQMNEEAGPAVLQAPSPDSILTDSTAGFSWSLSDTSAENPQFYVVEIAGDSTFAAPVPSDTTDSTGYQREESLKENGTYYWRVMVEDEAGERTSSDTMRFFVDVQQEAPNKFSLVSPEDGKGGLSRQPTLAWEKAVEADPADTVHYRVVLRQEATSHPPRKTYETDTDTTLTIPSELHDDTQWSWWVVAADFDSLQTHSDTLTFAVGTQVGIEDKKEIPDQYALHSAYPNPFNPSTNIPFDLPQSERVTITVYNTLGEIITTLVDRQMKAGSHRVTFKAADLASGIYIYQMRTDNFSTSRKMLLIK